MKRCAPETVARLPVPLGCILRAPRLPYSFLGCSGCRILIQTIVCLRPSVQSCWAPCGDSLKAFRLRAGVIRDSNSTDTSVILKSVGANQMRVSSTGQTIQIQDPQAIAQCTRELLNNRTQFCEHILAGRHLSLLRHSRGCGASRRHAL